MNARNDVLTAKRRWDRSRTASKTARTELQAAICQAVRSGDMTQAEVARIVGWPRQRVNTLLTQHFAEGND